MKALKSLETTPVSLQLCWYQNPEKARRLLLLNSRGISWARWALDSSRDMCPMKSYCTNLGQCPTNELYLQLLVQNSQLCSLRPIITRDWLTISQTYSIAKKENTKRTVTGISRLKAFVSRWARLALLKVLVGPFPQLPKGQDFYRD